MIDCFLCTCSTDMLRYGLSIATLERLKLSPALNIRVIRTPQALMIQGMTIQCSELEFRIKRRQIAEELAQTPIYMVADDDILPFDKDFAEKGVQVMERNPDYASGMYRPIGIDFSKHVYGGNEDFDEHDEGGGLWLARKGVVTEWPEEFTPELGWLSQWETKVIKSKGMKAGLFKNLKCNHLGLGFSTLFWNENGYGPIPIP